MGVFLTGMLVLGGVWGVFLMEHCHILTLLLLVEMGLMGLLLGMSCLGGFSWVVWAVLTAGVCESSLGLALLVKYVRCYGSDRVESCLQSRERGDLWKSV
uniref:NADH dehydrogenase subunit 4L n=1 Tax=Lima vulgaris TaxID=2671060 RepID=UPI0028FCCE43|nr:NADH dehydrogenase subunit 4L [Lima vulgaris]WNB40322.1 NADH dehydrogenase subunit 4L [Lima vulgaris]